MTLHDLKPHPLGAAVARATTWYNRLPAEQRARTFHASDLHRASGVCLKHMPVTFGLLGWRRERFWTRKDGRRVLRVHYSPPGTRAPRRPRGRPPIDLLTLFGG